MSFRGEWSPGATYAPNDLVTYKNVLWAANIGNTAAPDGQNNFWGQVANEAITRAFVLSMLSQNTHPGFIAGRWYPLVDGSTANTAVAAVDVLYLIPFYLPAPISFVNMVMRCVTGGAGSLAKAGIWANSPISMRPVGKPIISDNVGANTQTSTTIPPLAISGNLPAGNYWFGSKFTGTLPTMQCMGTMIGAWFRMGTPPNTTYPVNFTGYSFPDAFANDISQTILAEGATFTALNTAIVPNAAFQT